MNSVTFLSLVVVSVLVGCAEPTPEVPVPAPEPEASATSETVEEPAEQPPAEVSAREPTRASESEYNHDITKATTSGVLRTPTSHGTPLTPMGGIVKKWCPESLRLTTTSWSLAPVG